MCEADSRTEPSEDLGTDLESAHVLFPVQVDCIKPLPAGCAVVTKLREGGWVSGQWLMRSQNVRPAHLSSFIVLYILLALPFNMSTSLQQSVKPNYTKSIISYLFLDAMQIVLILKDTGDMFLHYPMVVLQILSSIQNLLVYEDLHFQCE